jgi:hypothetical protein
MSRAAFPLRKVSFIHFNTPVQIRVKEVPFPTQKEESRQRGLPRIVKSLIAHQRRRGAVSSGVGLLSKEELI